MSDIENDGFLVKVGFEVDENSIKGIIPQLQKAISNAQVEAKKETVEIKFEPNMKSLRQIKEILNPNNFGKNIKIEFDANTTEVQEKVNALRGTLVDFANSAKIYAGKAGKDYVKEMANSIKMSKSELEKLEPEIKEAFSKLTPSKQSKQGYNNFKEEYLNTQKLLKLKQQNVDAAKKIAKTDEWKTSLADTTKLLESLRAIETITNAMGGKGKDETLKFKIGDTNSVAGILGNVQTVGNALTAEVKKNIEDSQKELDDVWEEFFEDAKKKGFNINNIFADETGKRRKKKVEPVPDDTNTNKENEALKEQETLLGRVEDRQTALASKKIFGQISDAELEELEDLTKKAKELQASIAALKKEAGGVKPPVNPEVKEDVVNPEIKTGEDGLPEDGKDLTESQADNLRKKIGDNNNKLQQSNREIARLKSKIKQGGFATGTTLQQDAKKLDVDKLIESKDGASAFKFKETFEGYERFAKKNNIAPVYDVQADDGSLINIKEMYEKILPLAKEYEDSIGRQIAKAQQLQDEENKAAEKAETLLKQKAASKISTTANKKDNPPKDENPPAPEPNPDKNHDPKTKPDSHTSGEEIKVKVVPDTTNFKKELDEKLTALKDKTDFPVDITADVSNFKKELDEKLAPLKEAKEDFPVDITIKSNSKELMEEIQKDVQTLKDRIESEPITLNLEPEMKPVSQVISDPIHEDIADETKETEQSTENTLQAEKQIEDSLKTQLSYLEDKIKKERQIIAEKEAFEEKWKEYYNNPSKKSALATVKDAHEYASVTSENGERSFELEDGQQFIVAYEAAEKLGVSQRYLNKYAVDYLEIWEEVNRLTDDMPNNMASYEDAVNDALANISKYEAEIADVKQRVAASVPVIKEAPVADVISNATDSESSVILPGDSTAALQAEEKNINKVILEVDKLKQAYNEKTNTVNIGRITSDTVSKAEIQNLNAVIQKVNKVKAEYKEPTTLVLNVDYSDSLKQVDKEAVANIKSADKLIGKLKTAFNTVSNSAKISQIAIETASRQQELAITKVINRVRELKGYLTDVNKMKVKIEVEKPKTPNPTPKAAPKPTPAPSPKKPTEKKPSESIVVQPVGMKDPIAAQNANEHSRYAELLQEEEKAIATRRKLEEDYVDWFETAVEKRRLEERLKNDKRIAQQEKVYNEEDYKDEISWWKKALDEKQKSEKDLLSSDQLKRSRSVSNIGSLTASTLFIEADDGDTKINQYGAAVSAVTAKYKELTQAVDNMKNASASDFDVLADKASVLKKELKELQMAAMSSKYNRNNDSGKYGGTVIDQGENFDGNNVKEHLEELASNMREGTLETSTYDASTKKLTGTIKTADDTIQRFSLTYDNTTKATRKALGAEKEYLTHGQKIISQFKSKVVQIMEYVGAITVITQAWQAVRTGISTIYELDTAMTDLKKVTDETSETYNNFIGVAANVGQSVGSTAKDIISSAADWSKLGYSIEEATELAKNTGIYMNVSDVEDVSTATEHLTSTLQAYGDTVDSIDIVNKFNEIGNNYAISAQGLGEALTRSASSLVAAGVDIDKSVALITSANIITQDPESVGNAIKVLALRLRGASAQLEDMGEETDGLATSTSSLRNELKQLTGVDIMLDENNFKDTYEIMKEISGVWDNLSDVSQASVLETIAGKTRASVVAGLLQNMDTAEKAFESSKNSANSAIIENEKYLESLGGRVNKFSNQLQEFWANVIPTGALKSVVSMGTAMLDLASNLDVYKIAGAAALGVFNGKTGKLFDFNIGKNGFENSAKPLEKMVGLFKNFKQGNADIDIRSKMSETFTKDIDLFKEYQDLTSKGVNSEIAWTQTLAKGSETLKVNEAAIKSGTLSREAYTAQTKVLTETTTGLTNGTKAASIAMKGLSIVGGIAGGLLIGAAVSFGADLLNKWVNASKLAIEKGKEAISTISEISSKYKEAADTVNSISGDYASLSQSIGGNNENKGLSTEKYEKFLDVNNQMAELFPSLIAGYDSEGNALLTLKGSTEEITAKITELLEAKRQLANFEMAEGFNDAFEGTTKQAQELTKNVDEYEKQLKRVNRKQFSDSDVQNILGGLKNGQVEFDYTQKDEIEEFQKYLKDKLGESSYTETQGYKVQVKFDAVATDDEIESSVRAMGEKYSAAYENEAGNIASKMSAEKAKIQAQWDNLMPSFSAWLETEFSFNKLDSNMQGAVKEVMSNIDLSKYKDGEALKTDIRDSILIPLSNATPEIQEAMAKMLEVKPESFETGKEYGDYLRAQVDKISEGMNLNTESKSLLEKMFGLDEFETKYSAIEERLKTNGFKLDEKQFLDGLSTEDLDVLYNLTPVPGASVDDYKKQIEAAKAAAASASPIVVQTMFEEKSEFSSELDAYQTKLTTLREAMIKLKSGSMSSSDMLDLFQEIPELSAYVNDLETGINTLMQSSKSDGLDYLYQQLEAATSSDQVSQIQGIIQAFESLEGESENVANGISNIPDAISRVKGSYDAIISAKDNIRDYGAISTDTIGTLMTQYPELQGVLSNYLNGLASTEEVMSSLQTSYEDDLVNYTDMVLAKMSNDEAFWSGVMNNNSSAISSLANDYGLDISNWTSMAQAKAEIDSALISSLSSAWAGYFQIRKTAEGKAYVYGDASNINGANDRSTKKGAEQGAAFDAATSAATNYNNAIARLKAIASVDIGSNLTKSLNKTSDAAKSAKENLDKLADKYAGAQKAVIDVLDTEINKLKEIIEAEKKRLTLAKERGDSVLSAVDKLYSDEMDKIEKQKEAVTDFYTLKMDAIQDEIDALEKKNEKAERAYNLEKAKLDLLNSERQQDSYTYEEGKGYVYGQDKGAVADSQKALADVLYENKIAELNDLKDELNDSLEKETKALDASIKKLEEYKEKWSIVSSSYTDEQNKMTASQVLGAGWESDLLDGRMRNYDSFLSDYNTVQAQLNDITNETTANQKRVESLEKYKKKWEEASNAAENAKNRIYASELLGSQWESDVLSTRQSTLETFKTNYTKVQEAVAAAAEASASRISVASAGVNTSVQAITDALKKVEEDTTPPPVAAKYRIVTLTGKVVQDGFDNFMKADNWRSEPSRVKDLLSTRIQAYASGTLGVSSSQLALVDEIGDELIMRAGANGRLDYLTKGTSVVPHDLTENLMKWGEINPSLFKSLIKTPDVSKYAGSPVSNVTLSIGDIHLSGVNDSKSLANAIVTKLPNQLLQAINKR